MKDWTFRVSRNFARRQDISPAAKGVWLVIASYANKAGEAWPTKPQMVAACAVSHNTLDRLLIELRDACAVTWCHWRDEHGQQRNKYTLTTTQNLGGRPHPKSGCQSGTINQHLNGSRLKPRESALKLGIADPHEPP